MLCDLLVGILRVRVGVLLLACISIQGPVIGEVFRGAKGDDRYFAVGLDDLTLAAGALPDYTAVEPEGAGERAAMFPLLWGYATLDGGGEVYFVLREGASTWVSQWAGGVRVGRTIDPALFVLVGRVPGAGGGREAVEGTLFLPEASFDGMRGVRFSIADEQLDADITRFYEAQASHYQRLLDEGFMGAAWFRHQRDRARAIVEGAEGEDGEDGEGRAPAPPRRVDRTAVSDTYELFTGGRAIAENLALDRVVDVQEEGAGARDVALDSLEGITVAEIDWSAMMPEDASPRLDSLAGIVPHDQPVIFMPSVGAGVAMLRLAERSALPAVQSALMSSVREGVLERYEDQLGVRVSDLVELADRGAIGAVALTASDPYLRTGTDLALVMMSEDADSLYEALGERIDARVSGEGVGGGVTPRGSIWASNDRSVSSFLQKVSEDVVVLSNSVPQILRLRSVLDGELASVASLPEYAFFRARHEASDDEAMFLVLTDATIRKWCGPRWRIAASRRVRAQSVLLDLHAKYLDGMVRDRLGELVIQPARRPLVGDTVVVTNAGATSGIFNTIGFLTPIAEMDMEQVTEAEAEGYRNWKRGYERGWRTVFDPIAVQLRLSDGIVEADVSVLPVRSGGDYSEAIGLSLGEVLEPDDGDPHANALAQLIFAINRDSALFTEANQQIAPFFPQLRARPFDWVGDAISVYAADDPWWTRMNRMLEDDGVISLDAPALVGAPFGLHVEVSNPLLAAGFLTSVRAFVSGAAPGMLTWSNRTHAGKDYVRIAAADVGMLGEDFEDLEIFYFAAPSGLTLSLNEGVVQRAIDRANDGDEPGEDAVGEARAGAMLGENAELMIDRRLIDLLEALGSRGWERAVWAQSWANLPILNEWKRLYPDRDPVVVHREVWGVTPRCPGGGAYVWDAELQTMKSTVLGCPAEPRAHEVPIPFLESISRVRAGMTFEDLEGDATGLRTRVHLEMDMDGGSD